MHRRFSHSLWRESVRMAAYVFALGWGWVPVTNGALSLPFNPDDWQSNGSLASGDFSNGSVELTTEGGQNEANALFYEERFRFDRDFEVSFRYALASNANPADGFAFVLQDDSKDASGAIGAAMAYAGNPGIENSVAIGLDLYDGDGTSTGLIAGYGGEWRVIDNNRRVTSEVGFSPEPLSGINSFKNTDLTLDFTLGWEETDQTMTVDWEKVGGTESGSVAFLFATDSDGNIFDNQLGANREAWLGFTGGTGGATATQTLSNLTTTIPEPASFGPQPPARPLSSGKYRRRGGPRGGGTPGRVPGFPGRAGRRGGRSGR